MKHWIFVLNTNHN